MFDFDHPFFLPAWRRYAVVAVCLGWAVFELLQGTLFWTLIFAAAGVYCVKSLILDFDEEAVRAKAEKKKNEP